MPMYIVNRNKDDKGKHEVHKTSCKNLPYLSNQYPLGSHLNCKSAIKKAVDIGFSPADGCGHCCEECHTG